MKGSRNALHSWEFYRSQLLHGQRIAAAGTQPEGGSLSRHASDEYFDQVYFPTQPTPARWPAITSTTRSWRIIRGRQSMRRLRRCMSFEKRFEPFPGRWI
jgi:hypothetical protein